VLSGTSTAADVETTPEQLRPDVVIPVIGDLLNHLERTQRSEIS
jgi:hypothetical protein